MKHTIGLIGAGAMGHAIGTRLLESGSRLNVYDRNPPKVAALVEKGATGMSNPAEVGAASGSVILSLNSEDAVAEVVFGEAGVLSRAKAGLLVIDMSSVSPAATRAFSSKAVGMGHAWVDAPLSGGAPKALTGELTLMLGGEAGDVTAAREVLSQIASNITHMGSSGAGQATKLINQVLCGIGFMAVAEATALAEDAGIDVEKIPGALRGGRADSAILQEYMPRFAARDYRKTGRLDNFIKDLNGAMDLARQKNTPVPFTSLSCDVHRIMTRAGYGAEDEATMIEYYLGPNRKD
ncbi:NAD(P)-dependent oxidoreductase [Roseobacter sp. OBYS 0001]|uniref:NAD(P)-dependent oxidoreductase n=1 Tax=Roseobacter sp. OBYS 0001 TaxID=882651 RepID=UPI001BBBE4D7|nr:NAD(P)-dependent oxidoreductase [Roseobacter sp. OBYS 0001]GIT87294.1 6-phosphogluconate dehydrogenase [Roseobacter sp. OBYS 0001]